MSGPTSAKEAALRIVLDEVAPMLEKAETLRKAMQGAAVELRGTREALESIAQRPAPRPVNPWLVGAIAGAISAALVAVAAVGVVWFSTSQVQEQARVGRAVLAAFPSLDAGTRAKIQEAINHQSQ